MSTYLQSLGLVLKKLNLTQQKQITQEQNGMQKKNIQLECGLMPNVMLALPNIDGALCSTPQSFADAHY